MSRQGRLAWAEPRCLDKLLFVLQAVLAVLLLQGLGGMRRFLLAEIVNQARLMQIHTAALGFAADTVASGAAVVNADITSIFQTMDVPILVLVGRFKLSCMVTDQLKNFRG